MKIMFYINSIRHGGAERVMSNLATTLSEKENECILVTSFQNESEYLLGHKVRRISLFENKLCCNFLKRNIALISSLRKCLKEERPDILISFMAEPNFRSILASIGLKNKTLISVRNDPNKEYSNVFTRILAKTLFSFADGIVFQTVDAKKWFPQIIQKKSKVIFNQVDETFYNTRYVGVRRDVVSTGRLVSQKNHKMLIKAFSSISDQISDNLIIYGDGEMRTELEALISELDMEKRIFLPGVIDDVSNTIKSAKLFVLSSDYEGMPNSLMEAMALGLPCISTDCPCGGPRVLLEGVADEFLIPIGEEEELALKLLYLLTRDNKCLEEIAVRVRKKADLFKPNVIFEQWNTYIEYVLNGYSFGVNKFFLKR